MRARAGLSVRDRLRRRGRGRGGSDGVYIALCIPHVLWPFIQHSLLLYVTFT